MSSTATKRLTGYLTTLGAALAAAEDRTAWVAPATHLIQPGEMLPVERQTLWCQYLARVWEAEWRPVDRTLTERPHGTACRCLWCTAHVGGIPHD